MASSIGKSSAEVSKHVGVDFLRLNYAYVILNSTLKHVGVFSVNDDCYQCPFRRQEYENLYSREPPYFKVDTGKPIKWRVLKNNHDDYIQPDYKSGLLCEITPVMGGYGVYRLDVRVTGCALNTVVQPVNVYLPLLLFSLILLSTIFTYGLVKLFLKRNNEAKPNDGLNLTARRDNLDIMPSLHFLRGVLLILIIFVTTGGGGYPIFSRNFGGLTVAECLFFAYTLSIGLKIPLTFDEESRKTTSVFSTIFVRFLFLFLLGLLIGQTGLPLRFLAVPLWAPLPRVAVAYLVAAGVYMFAKNSSGKLSKNIFHKAYANIVTLLWSWIVAGFLLATMIVSIFVFYSTECKPIIDTESFSWTSQGRNCEYNTFSEVFNKNLLAANRDETFYIDSYYAFTKGLMGVISSILTALIGLKAGVVYIQHEGHADRMKLWCLWSTLLGITGIVLAAKSSILNFNLWPIATIFLISSLTFIVYTFTYYITEIREFSSTIVTSCGVASMATLSGHLLFSQSFPFYWDLDTHFFYLCQSALIVILWIVLTACWMKWRVVLISRVVSNEGTKRAILAW